MKTLRRFFFLSALCPSCPELRRGVPFLPRVRRGGSRGALLALSLVEGCLLLSCSLPRDNPYDPKHTGYEPLVGPNNPSALVKSDTSVELAWRDPNSLEAGYFVERSEIAWTGFAEVFRSGPDVQKFTDRNCLPGKTYYYRIFAFNEIYPREGEDALLSVRTTSPMDRPILFGLTNLKTLVGENFVSLTWSDTTANKLGYLVERKMDNDPLGYLLLDSLGLAKTQYLDLQLIPNHRYWYRVSAFNYAGPGPATTLPVTILSPFAPDPATIALWHFDDLNPDSAMDESGHGHHGVLKNLTQTSKGKFGNCYYFPEGKSAEMVVGENLFNDSAFTLDFYFKPQVELDSSLRDTLGLIWAQGDPLMVYYAGDGQDGFFTAVVECQNQDVILAIRKNFSTTEWTAVSIRVSPTRKTLLLNQLIQIDLGTPGNPNPPINPLNGAFRVGRVDLNGQSRYFKGFIDEVRILNTAIPQ